METGLSIIPIVKLARLWTLNDNEAHIERQSVFQLETLCNHTLGVVVLLWAGKRFQSLLKFLKYTEILTWVI